jgi:hypothetical protein
MKLTEALSAIRDRNPEPGRKHIISAYGGRRGGKTVRSNKGADVDPNMGKTSGSVRYPHGGYVIVQSRETQHWWVESITGQLMSWAKDFKDAEGIIDWFLKVESD